MLRTLMALEAAIHWPAPATSPACMRVSKLHVAEWLHLRIGPHQCMQSLVACSWLQT